MGKSVESMGIGRESVTPKLQERESNIVGDVQKGIYRRLPLSEKRRKENFRNSVRQCLDRGEVLTIERQRMFSKRARQYMLAYHSIELSKVKGESGAAGESNDKNKKPHVKLEMSAYLVEKIIKTYKSHRGATDFDSAYIDAIVNDMKSENSGDKSIEQQ